MGYGDRQPHPWDDPEIQYSREVEELRLRGGYSPYAPSLNDPEVARRYEAMHNGQQQYYLDSAHSHMLHEHFLRQQQEQAILAAIQNAAIEEQVANSQAAELRHNLAQRAHSTFHNAAAIARDLAVRGVQYDAEIRLKGSEDTYFGWTIDEDTENDIKYTLTPDGYILSKTHYYNEETPFNAPIHNEWLNIFDNALRKTIDMRSIDPELF